MKIFGTSEDVKDYLLGKEYVLEDILKANENMVKEAECEKIGHKEKRGEAIIYINELHIPQAYVTCKKCGANYGRGLNKEEREEYLLKKTGGLSRIF